MNRSTKLILGAIACGILVMLLTWHVETGGDQALAWMPVIIVLTAITMVLGGIGLSVIK